MPWHIEDDNDACDGFAVVKDDDGEVEGCHSTRDEAEAQLSALYANEDEMSKTADVLETKGISVITADLKSAKAKDGTYDLTLSIPNEDRDGEVIDAKALKWLMQGRMPVDVDHGMTVLTTVGSGRPVYEGDALKLADFRFASTPLGQEVKTLVDEEHISKMSVAFMAAEREKDNKDGKVHIRDAELLNAAIVAIPSLREADIVLAAKSALAKLGARNSAKDAELIQSMHDNAAALGALCGAEKTAGCNCGQRTPADTDPEAKTAAPAAVDPPAEVLLAQARAAIAQAESALLP